MFGYTWCWDYFKLINVEQTKDMKEEESYNVDVKW